MVIRPNLPIFVCNQIRNKMEKYEFRAKQPLWIWATAIVMIGCVLIYAVKSNHYFVLAIWGVYYIFIFVNSRRSYTITPDSFIMKQGVDKLRTFLLENITAIERKYTKDHQLKSLIVRYTVDNSHHNFFEIKKYDTDAEGILNAILDYRPSVPVY